MITISEEMKNPMDQTERKLILHTLTMFGRLPDNLFGGEYDITQKPGLEFPVRAFILGERKDISRIIACQVLPVKKTDLSVIEEKKTDLPFPDPLTAQNIPHQFFYSQPIEAETALVAFDYNVIGHVLI
jgi:hypothetical protein